MNGNDLATSIETVDRNIEESHSHLQELQQQVKDTYNALEQQRRIKKSLQLFQRSPPLPTPSSSTQSRHHHALIPPQIKALIIKNVLYEESMTWGEAIHVYNVSRASISRILQEEKKRKALEEGEEQVEPHKKRRGHQSPITPSMLTWLLLELEQNSQVTLEEMVYKIENKFNVNTSASALERMLKRMAITWKNVVPILEDWNSPHVIEARALFVSSLGQFFTRPIVYIDETGFNLQVKRRRGYALRGEPALLTLLPKGKRITLIAALSTQGIAHYQIVESLPPQKRGTSSGDFRSFLFDLFPKIPQESIIILDNCRIHHAASIDSLWTMALQTYKIDKAFLPPYSPFLNPIEYAFNFLKTEVMGSIFHNRGELVNIIEEKLHLITAEKAQGFFSQSTKYYTQVKLMLPFRGKPLEPEVPVNDDQQNEIAEP